MTHLLRLSGLSSSKDTAEPPVFPTCRRRALAVCRDETALALAGRPLEEETDGPKAVRLLLLLAGPERVAVGEMRRDGVLIDGDRDLRIARRPGPMTDMTRRELGVVVVVAVVPVVGILVVPVVVPPMPRAPALKMRLMHFV
jgi:hypothetical protein